MGLWCLRAVCCSPLPCQPHLCLHEGTVMLWTLWWHPQIPVWTADIPNAQLGNACTKSTLTPWFLTFPCPNSSQPLDVKVLLAEGDYFVELG